MLSNITTIKWFNPKQSVWVTDYIQDIDKCHCVISNSENSLAYEFWISKKLVEDIYLLLDETMNEIRKHEGLESKVRVINLGLNSSDDFVSGKFEIYKKDTEDDELSS
jgi:hypothetical protein